MSGCGGCEGRGAHRKACRDPLGYLADRVEDLGDQIGSNNIGQANEAYRIAADIRRYNREVLAR